MKLKKSYNGLRNVASILLLFGYFLNVISFESFHQAVHNHDHSALHTEEAEADACHRAIYHGETSHDCEHKSHTSEKHNNCDLCKVLISRSSEFINARVDETKTFGTPTKYLVLGSEIVFEPLPLQSFLRGPPNA